MRFVIVLLLMLPMLSACATYNREPNEASAAEVQRALYSHHNPFTLSLYTVVRNTGGQGAHAALLINGSHRALFDPAGSWFHRNAPRRGDLHYGMTPQMLDFYENYHARETHHIIVQTIEVPREVADAAIRAAEAQGLVTAAYCTQATAAVLQTLPGFSDIRATWYPTALMEQLASRPGMRTERVYRDNPAENRGLLAAQQTAVMPAQQRQTVAAGRSPAL